jgi:hypothetical protein
MNKPTRRPFRSALALSLLGLVGALACSGEGGTGADAGHERTCDLPSTCLPAPASVCKNESTLVSYVNPTCLLHQCRWSTTETSCACANGSCVAPADAGR